MQNGLEYQRLRELFIGACTDPVGSKAYLDRHCAGDTAMRQQVEALLENDAVASAVFGTPTSSSRSRLAMIETVEELFEERPPAVIGRYRVIRRIAEGGMGVVYEAEQESPRRRVALKIVRNAVASPAMLRRLEYEAQVLSLLRHPCIAQIHEAGTVQTRRGSRPFFAMEMVRGRPLTLFAAENQLTVRERLALLAQVAEAVHHAHQKGVIHRDLKPGNILVDDEGKPRILDFGVARCTDIDLAVTTIGGDHNQFVGTLQYMSPEQASGHGAAIDTRSDIYALGVIAYEMLCGRSPYELSATALHEAVRTICEVEPPSLGTLVPSLRGDVETIVAKAMQKDRERRYDSAAALSADIRRHLADEPITARPPSALYQLHRFARRNRPLVAGATAALAFLILAIVGTSYGFARATSRELEAKQAQQDSEDARIEAETLVAFLASMLTSVNANELGRDVLVTDVLDEASRSIDAKLADRPLAEARLQQAIGNAYCALSRYAEGRQHLERSVVLYRRHRGVNDRLTVGATFDWHSSLNQLGIHDTDQLSKDIAVADRVLGSDDPSVIDAMLMLAFAHKNRGDLLAAEEVCVDAHAAAVTSLRSPDDLTIQARWVLAAIYRLQGRLDEAKSLLFEAMEIEPMDYAFGGALSLHNANQTRCSAANELGLVYLDEGNYALAEAVFEALSRREEQLVGHDHGDTLTALGNLALTYTRMDRFEQARQILADVVEGWHHVAGPEHIATLSCVNNLALAHSNSGHYAEAELLWHQQLEVFRRAHGNDHQFTMMTLNNLGKVLCDRGQYEEALQLLQEALGRQQRVLGPLHPHTLLTQHNLGILSSNMGDQQRAITILEDAWLSRTAVLGATHPNTLQSRFELATALMLSDETVEAEAILRDTVDALCETQGSGHSLTGRCLVRLGQCLAAMDRRFEAEDVLEEGRSILLATVGPRYLATMEAEECLAALRTTWLDEAENVALRSR